MSPGARPEFGAPPAQPYAGAFPGQPGYASGPQFQPYGASGPWASPAPEPPASPKSRGTGKRRVRKPRVKEGGLYGTAGVAAVMGVVLICTGSVTTGPADPAGRASSPLTPAAATAPPTGDENTYLFDIVQTFDREGSQLSASQRAGLLAAGRKACANIGAGLSERMAAEDLVNDVKEVRDASEPGPIDLTPSGTDRWNAAEVTAVAHHRLCRGGSF